MNTETGDIYRGEAAIAAAKARGEPIVPVSGHVAALMEAAQRAQTELHQLQLANQQIERARAVAHRRAKRKRKASKSARKQNRSRA